MATPANIFISEETPKDGSAPFFRVATDDIVFEPAIRFPTRNALAAWLDKHDYRYVWGTRGHWRLP